MTPWKAILVVACVAMVADAAEYVNPKYTAATRAVRKVLILPAQMQVVKSGIKGAEGMAKESDALSANVTALLVRQLAAAKVDVIANPFTEEALKNNEELNATLQRLQNRYDTLARQLHSKLRQVRSGRYSLGDEVATLGPAADADAIIFIRGSGVVPTGGKKAFSLLVSHWPAFNMLHTYVSLADSKTGEIIAVLNLLRPGNFNEDPDKVLGKTIANSFKKLPFAVR